MASVLSSTTPLYKFFPTWQMFGVSVSLAKLYLLLCLCGQCTCKLETLTLFETHAASGCFENGHKGSYCGTSFNQAHNTQLAFKLMTLLCISSIDLLFPKLKGKMRKKTVFQVSLNANHHLKLCGYVSFLCSIR